MLLQTKYTRIKPGQDASHFAWCDVSEWFVCARKYMDPFKDIRKLFVFVTNKEVRDCPNSLDSDCVVIRQDNLHTFFAPCLLASARLAQSGINSTCAVIMSRGVFHTPHCYSHLFCCCDVVVIIFVV